MISKLDTRIMLLDSNIHSSNVADRININNDLTARYSYPYIQYLDVIV